MPLVNKRKPAIVAFSIPNIMPSDGTKLLQDAEYFVFVKLDESIQLFNPDIDPTL